MEAKHLKGPVWITQPFRVEGRALQAIPSLQHFYIGLVDLTDSRPTVPVGNSSATSQRPTILFVVLAIIAVADQMSGSCGVDFDLDLAASTLYKATNPPLVDLLVLVPEPDNQRPCSCRHSQAGDRDDGRPCSSGHGRRKRRKGHREVNLCILHTALCVQVVQ
jgi:hypothetical protein